MTHSTHAGTKHHFATIGLFTERGRRVAAATGGAAYCGLTSVGDVVTYNDGSEAVILDGAASMVVIGDRPVALVGSMPDNGDVIANSRHRKEHATSFMPKRADVTTH